MANKRKPKHVTVKQYAESRSLDLHYVNSVIKHTRLDLNISRGPRGVRFFRDTELDSALFNHTNKSREITEDELMSALISCDYVMERAIVKLSATKKAVTEFLKKNPLVKSKIENLRRKRAAQSQVRSKAPGGATHFIDGLFYKIGVHGKVFYHSADANEWLKSNKDRHEILIAKRI